ncbi:MAG: helix-turn-helix transcriptional regulator [Gammaproteobacteria bacterium]|nr:helix-turn-helix transcriptional regulator [Gammaproteobacteria bacterium]
MGRKKSHITNRIRELRKLAGGRTQQELAERVGVTRQTIVAIERGNYSPSLEVAFRIAAEFDRTVDEVFSFERDS